MELSGNLFAPFWPLLFAALFFPSLWYALRWADWGRLGERYQQHVYLGAMVCLFFLWNMRVEMVPGFFWHLSGMVTITLMFGWSLAVVGGSVVLLGIVVTGLNDWSGYFPSVMLCVVIPAAITQVVLGLVRAYAPKHFFVFVLVNAFLAGGLVFVLMAGLITGGLLLSGSYSWAELQHNFLSLAPMMLFPESMLNGWIVAILVGFKPHWVGSFSDEEYVQGK
ncbi:energy-coupling factor ABC transporter permease [Thiolapillus sp.]